MTDCNDLGETASQSSSSPPPLEHCPEGGDVAPQKSQTWEPRESPSCASPQSSPQEPECAWRPSHGRGRAYNEWSGALPAGAEDDDDVSESECRTPPRRISMLPIERARNVQYKVLHNYAATGFITAVKDGRIKNFFSEDVITPGVYDIVTAQKKMYPSLDAEASA